MVVDDHAVFRMMAVSLLAADGFQVIGEAATGAQALTVVAALEPDVVLLDVQLPDLDGFAVLRALRRNQIPSRVVLCSVRPAADFRVRLPGCGASGFLTKAELTGAAIRELLGG